MKSDSLEDALKKRLQDYTPAQSVPSWQQMQRRMQLHANAHPELEIRPRMERKTLNDPEIREKQAEWEEEYDSKLAGTSGLFRVMLDSAGTWVPGTTEILAAPIPGRNVTVPYELKGERR